MEVCLRNMYFKTLFFLALVAQFQVLLGQLDKTRYEVELLTNPTPGRKDTREVNSVLVFGKDLITVESRRKNQTFKELAISDIRSVKHSFSRRPSFGDDTSDMLSSIFTGMPVWLLRKEKHWLTIITNNDYAVLKLENDNYRLIIAEFEVRGLKVENIAEGRN